MYAKDTILTLKEPRKPDEETGEPFPYNTVRVIGESPVSHAQKGDWEGADAKGVLLEAKSNFGATLDEPFGKCRALYDVESVPEPVEIDAKQVVRVIDSSSAEAGPTPEEVFAEKAPGTPPAEGQRRGRGGVSPLGDTPAPAKSPLDAPAPRQEIAAPPAPPLLPDTPAEPETPAAPPEPAPAAPPEPPVEPPQAPPGAPEGE